MTTPTTTQPSVTPPDTADGCKLVTLKEPRLCSCPCLVNHSGRHASPHICEDVIAAGHQAVILSIGGPYRVTRCLPCATASGRISGQGNASTSREWADAGAGTELRPA